METTRIDQKKNGDDNNQNIIDKCENQHKDIFDVAIIGGGFAGLSAALLLGRYLRSTIIFDIREPRKSLIHGYLGFEKISREKLIQKAWENVIQYKSVYKVEERVQNVEKDTKNNFFIITSEKKKEEDKDKNTGKDKIYDKNKSDIKRKTKARFLIIASGIKYLKPADIKNFDEFDGNGIWHCPHCDGFEATNKILIIIVSDNKNKEAVDYAKLFLGWTKEITLFVYETKNKNNQNQRESYFTDKQKNEDKLLGINIIENDNIAEIVADPKSKIKGVFCKSGKYHKAEVIFYHFEQIIQNEIAIQIGCELDEGYVKVNEKQMTTVSNVYAAGDIDTDRHYAVLAAASGALAAISIYEELLKSAIKITKIKEKIKDN